MEETEKLNKEYKHLIIEVDVYNSFHNVKPNDITVSELLGEMLLHKTYLRICFNKIRRKRREAGNIKFDKAFK